MELVLQPAEVASVASATKLSASVVRQWLRDPRSVAESMSAAIACQLIELEIVPTVPPLPPKKRKKA